MSAGPPPWWRLGTSRDELAALRRDLERDGLLSNLAASQVEKRLAALEELMAARWPRRWWVRRRIARDLRASVKRYRWAGPDFESQREQALSHESDPPGGTVAFPPMPLSRRPPGRHR